MTLTAEQDAMLERLLKKHGIGHDACGADCPRPDCCEACRALAFGRELLQAVQERDRWISVEEDLPPDESYTLISFKRGDGKLQIRSAYFLRGRWYGGGAYTQPFVNISHWRPLPKPPGVETYADLFMEEK